MNVLHSLSSSQRGYAALLYMCIKASDKLWSLKAAFNINFYLFPLSSQSAVVKAKNLSLTSQVSDGLDIGRNTELIFKSAF